MVFDLLLLPTSGLDVRCSTVRDPECVVGLVDLRWKASGDRSRPGGGGGTRRSSVSDSLFPFTIHILLGSLLFNTTSFGSYIHAILIISFVVAS
jgi:hypothetical protein